MNFEDAICSGNMDEAVRILNCQETSDEQLKQGFKYILDNDISKHLIILDRLFRRLPKKWCKKTLNNKLKSIDSQLQALTDEAKNSAQASSSSSLAHGQQGVRVSRYPPEWLAMMAYTNANQNSSPYAKNSRLDNIQKKINTALARKVQVSDLLNRLGEQQGTWADYQPLRERVSTRSSQSSSSSSQSNTGSQLENSPSSSVSSTREVMSDNFTPQREDCDNDNSEDIAQRFCNPINHSSLLKSNDNLRSNEMARQDALTDACYRADLDKVKALVAQGANLVVADSQGRQPLAAAIWGLAFPVLFYLEQQICYSKDDWFTVTTWLKEKHGDLTPHGKLEININAWFEHYQSNSAGWFYDYDACRCREIEEIKVTWERESHVASIKRCCMPSTSSTSIYNEQSQKFIYTLFNPNGFETKFNNIQVKFLIKLCNFMTNRLSQHDVSGLNRVDMNTYLFESKVSFAR